ncbi:sensor histidine kinase [Mucilaginibacter sp. BT774]|uniref:sensor histidine kinase n=1 Tax=Mucilaginibacter sp. BT774 TaxID=3062276 RepID=UPI002676A84C|nr:histidine kinase [Mucilaginibacter sp. BT774]MDO3625046.1 histidine kinase [Mucilaginibacter sp. BT774]
MIKIRKKDWIEVVLHVAFWVGVFYTLLSLTETHVTIRVDHAVGAIKKDPVVIKDVRHTLSAHLFITLGFLVLLFYGNIFLLFKKALQFKNILIRVAIPVAYFAAIFTTNHYFDQQLSVVKSDQPFIQTFQLDQKKGTPPALPVVKRNLELRTDALVFAREGLSNTILFIFIIVFGLSIAYFFLKEWARVEKMRSVLQAVQLDTEVKFLKSQVNPHFLFNTLNNLFSMAQKKGNDELADGISKLSGMMRYMIYESNEENVPLKKEIEYLENCILLNKLRYADDEIKVIFNYPKQTEGIFIAPMLFIPFVENAFKHGVAIGQSSEIDISISVENKHLAFTCENTIYSVKKMEGDKSGIGLENVKRRLDLLYTGKYKLFIITDENRYIVNLGITIE